MATMHMFNSILSSRGLDAATQYAMAAQFGPGLDTARRIREVERSQPMRPGKTQRDIVSGATARLRKNREQRRFENTSRHSPNNGSSNGQQKKAGKKK